MRTAVAFLLGVLTLPALVQDSQPSASDPPKSICRYDRLGPIRRVNAESSFEELSHFDDARHVFFPAETMVTVSRQEGSWSCVTGSSDRTTSGSPVRTGWMPTSQIEPVNPRNSKNRNGN